MIYFVTVFLLHNFFYDSLTPHSFSARDASTTFTTMNNLKNIYFFDNIQKIQKFSGFYNFTCYFINYYFFSIPMFLVKSCAKVFFWIFNYPQLSPRALVYAHHRPCSKWLPIVSQTLDFCQRQESWPKFNPLNGYCVRNICVTECAQKHCVQQAKRKDMGKIPF